MDPLTLKVTEALTRYNMLPSGAPLGVAVSGGADSVCLLHVLRSLYQPVTVLHVNHHLRGSESDADEQFVRELAASLGLPVLVFPVQLPEEGNLEEAARNARREVFRSLISAGTLARIALGHTRNDQAETVLFRLLRGSYTTGLAGMRAVTQEGLIRPLLDIFRHEIEAWLRARNLPWREDSSNRDSRFARNRIRHSLLPQLEAEWNPSLSDILANHAQLAQEDEDYWASQIPPARPILLIADLFQQSPALRRRIVRDTIRHVKGDLRGVDFRHIQQVLDLASAPDGHGRVQIPGTDVMRSFDWLRFDRLRSAPVERNWSFEVHPPAVVPIPGQDTEIVLDLRDTLVSEGLHWPEVVSVCGGALEIRNWRPGDRYLRQGHGQERKIKELFHETRVPLWDRRDWPILCAGDRIIWARSFGPAAPFLARGSGPSLVISERKRIAAAPAGVLRV